MLRFGRAPRQSLENLKVSKKVEVSPHGTRRTRLVPDSFPGWRSKLAGSKLPGGLAFERSPDGKRAWCDDPERTPFGYPYDSEDFSKMSSRNKEWGYSSDIHGGYYEVIVDVMNTSKGRMLTPGMKCSETGTRTFFLDDIWFVGKKGDEDQREEAILEMAVDTARRVEREAEESYEETVEYEAEYRKEELRQEAVELAAAARGIVEKLRSEGRAHEWNGLWDDLDEVVGDRRSILERIREIEESPWSVVS